MPAQREVGRGRHQHVVQLHDEVVVGGGAVGHELLRDAEDLVAEVGAQEGGRLGERRVVEPLHPPDAVRRGVGRVPRRELLPDGAHVGPAARAAERCCARGRFA